MRRAEQAQTPLRPNRDVYDRILEKVIDIDPEAEEEYLRLELQLSKAGSDIPVAALLDALEACQENARRAQALYARAYVDIERAGVDLRIIEATLVERARADLEALKRAGQRTKQITERDVANYVDVHHTDEVRELESKKAGNKMVLETFEHLARLWRDRARALEALVTARKARGSFDS